MKSYFKRVNTFSVIILLVFTSIFTYINTRYESMADFQNKILSTNNIRVLNVYTGDGTNKILGEMKEYLEGKLKDKKGVLGMWESISYNLPYIQDITNSNGTKSDIAYICVYEMPEKDCLLGEKIEKLENNEVIVPKYYYPNVINKYDGKEYIDGETLIGKTIQLEISYDENEKESFIYEAEVVGVIDNIKYGNTNPMVFTSKEDYIELLAKSLNISEEAVLNKTSCISIYCATIEDYEEYIEIALDGKYKKDSLGSFIGVKEHGILEKSNIQKDIYVFFRNIALGVYIFILLIMLVVKTKNKKKLSGITNYLIEVWITQIVSLLIFLPYIIKRWFEVSDLLSIEKYNTYNYHLYMFIIPMAIMMISLLLHIKEMKEEKGNG